MCRLESGGLRWDRPRPVKSLQLSEWILWGLNVQSSVCKMRPSKMKDALLIGHYTDVCRSGFIALKAF